MAERKGALTQESASEKLHVCPTCEREFKTIEDYPRVLIKDAKFLTPGDVPTEILDYGKADLLEAPTEGWNRELLPTEVLKYFKENEAVDKLVHTDKFVYFRPPNPDGRFSVLKKVFKSLKPEIVSNNEAKPKRPPLYIRQYNYASDIEDLLENQNLVKGYLNFLETLVGREIATNLIFPKLEGNRKGLLLVPTAKNNKADFPIYIKLEEGEQQTSSIRLVEVQLWGDGPNIGSAGGSQFRPLLTIGRIDYEGRYNSTSSK